MMDFALIGFGEVGSIFARDLRARGAGRISAFDVAPAAQARAAAAGFVTVAPSPTAAIGRVEIVFVAVTAGSVLDAVRSLVGALGHGPFVVDVNSVSPSTKLQAEQIVREAGGRYLEAAVMTSVPARGLSSPMLLGGPHAAEFMAAMASFGMALTLYSDRVGPASSVKMCRSIMIKGLEALTTECMLTARYYGVEEDVLRSLSDTLPNEDWHALARYVMSRALIHGKRRSEEMREVARTVDEAGIAPLLSRPVADRQLWASKLGLELSADQLGSESLSGLLDAMTEALDRRQPRAKVAGFQEL